MSNIYKKIGYWIFFLIQLMVYSFPLVIPLTTEELTLSSERVVVGKVRKIECRWNQEKSLICTYITLESRQLLKGENITEVVILEVPGGEVGNKGLKVFAMPTFFLDEEVLVFLSAKNEINNFRVVGCYQGKYTIKGSQIKELGIRSNVFLDRVKRIIKEQRKP
ncbi:MAG: hypothetical protein ABII74_01855 [Elusimicrobiota bacterium]